MSEDSEPALLLCHHEVGGSGRFMPQQRALLALASAFAYMLLIEKCDMGERVNVWVPGHYPFVCVVNWMHMHCVGHLEDPTSLVIPTGTKEPTNQREPLQGFVTRRHVITLSKLWSDKRIYQAFVSLSQTQLIYRVPWLCLQPDLRSLCSRWTKLLTFGALSEQMTENSWFGL